MPKNELTASEYMFKQHADHFITIFNWLNDSNIQITGELDKKIKRDFHNILVQISDLNPKFKKEEFNFSEKYIYAYSGGINRILGRHFPLKNNDGQKSIVFNDNNHIIINEGLIVIYDMLGDYLEEKLSHGKSDFEISKNRLNMLDSYSSKNKKGIDSKQNVK